MKAAAPRSPGRGNRRPGGLAPNDVPNNTRTTNWQEFATGQYAFGENGTWQLANAKKAGFPYGVISIPARDGGPELKPWKDAVAAARGRTSNGLGTRYPVISQQLWTAVQSALSGGKSPEAALKAARSAAAAGKG